MKFEKRHLLWFVAAVLFVISLWRIWQAHDSGLEDLWPGKLDELVADLTFEDVRYTRNLDDKVRWILEAKTARLFQDTNNMDLRGIMVYLFPEGGGEVRIVADSGDYDIDGGEMSLEGNVKVRSAKGQTLTSSMLRFSQTKDLIWTDKRVFITGSGVEMEANGLEYDLRRGKMTVTRQTSVLPESGGLQF